MGYSYDEDDLLVQAGALSATRDAENGRLTVTTLGSLSTSQSYSGFGELGSMAATYASTSLLETTYTRDGLGRIETKVEVLGGVTTTYAYTYDLTGRLTQVTADGVAVEAYAYDTNGNRTSFTGPGGVVAATYDAQDRLLTYGSSSYTYTAAGELTSKVQGANTTGYTYDVLGNLLRVDRPDGTDIEYVVDGAGRRTGRKVNGVLQEGWLYQDALNPVAELDGTGAVMSRFVYGTRSYVPDYMVRGGDTFRIVSDERGSVRLVVDVATGAVAQELAYDAFGRVLLDTNPGFQPFGYAGGLYDSATGLVRFGARDYDAEVGRWTTKDPLGLAGGMNVYTYVGGDPVNFVDPFGLCPQDEETGREQAFLPGALGGALLGAAVRGGAVAAGASLSAPVLVGGALLLTGALVLSRPAAQDALGDALDGLGEGLNTLKDKVKDEFGRRKKSREEQAEEVEATQAEWRRRGQGERIRSTGKARTDRKKSYKDLTGRYNG